MRGCRTLSPQRQNRVAGDPDLPCVGRVRPAQDDRITFVRFADVTNYDSDFVGRNDLRAGSLVARGLRPITTKHYKHCRLPRRAHPANRTQSAGPTVWVQKRKSKTRVRHPPKTETRSHQILNQRSRSQRPIRARTYRSHRSCCRDKAKP